MLPGLRIPIRIVGSSGSGKTRLVEELVRRLKAGGFRVVYVKSAGRIDVEGKDSSRVAAAGADAVLVYSRGEVLLRGSFDSSLPALALLLPEGIYILEGFTSMKNVPAICASPGDERCSGAGRVIGEYRGNIEEVLRVVVDYAVSEATRRLPGADCGDCGYPTCRALAEAVLRGEASSSYCRFTRLAELRVDGELIPLNPFTRNLLARLIEAYARSLKGVPASWRSIEVRVVAAEAREMGGKDTTRSDGGDGGVQADSSS